MALYTKKLIMTTFQEMLAEMPFDKITVSALVKRAEGSPNTFYYHYQDIYSVLEWIVVREICTPLRYDESVSAEDWCMQALTLLRARQPPKPSIMCLILFPGTDWIRCLRTFCTAPFRTPNKRNLPQGLPRKGQLFCAKKENCANLRIEPTVLKFGGSGRFRHGIRVQIPLNL